MAAPNQAAVSAVTTTGMPLTSSTAADKDQDGDVTMAGNTGA